jgi:D-serine deaminase-like pyridoxal phosphate-dependent protein
MRAVTRRAPAAAGARIFDEEAVETPCLVLDAASVEHNIAALASMLESALPVTARVHVKSHKCPQLALRQISLSKGTAKGVCCQKVCEAEAMAAVGIDDILLSNQVVARPKIRRLASLVRGGCALSVLIDSAENAHVLSEVASSEGVTFGVLAEVDVGQRRCGVSSPAAAADLAELVRDLPGLSWRGLQCYQGAAQHIIDAAERRAVISKVVDIARECVEECKRRGIECPVVTGGGSGTFSWEAASGVFTEVQPGSTVVWDRHYSEILAEDGLPLGERVFRHALQILATVISRSTEGPSPRVVLDCGLKAMSGESGLPRLLYVLPLDGSAPGSAPALKVVGLSDEHTQISLDEESAAFCGLIEGGMPRSEAVDKCLPQIGQRVLVAPGHCDPTCNLHDFAMWVREGVVEDVWDVAGRSPGL